MQANRAIIFLLTLLLIACKQKELKTEEYVKYIKSSKSELLKVREVGDFKFEVFYMPQDYKIAIQLKKNNITKAEYAKQKEQIEGMQYFTLKITPLEGNKSILKYNLQSEEDYQARLAYFSFGMQKDVFLETENEKLACDLYHFERAYDLSNYRVFDLAFEQNETQKDEDKTLVIHSDFFGTGPIKFKYSSKDLKSLPKLKVE